VSRALERLADGVAAVLGRSLEPGEARSFGNYLELLQKWQRVHRFVGSANPEWIVEHLFLDSLLFLRVIPADTASVVDIGSGAGFPGVPIKIVRSTIDLTLIESRERRVSFLSSVIRELRLDRIRVFAGRAEAAPDSMKGRSDAAVARCAGDPSGLLPVAARLVRPGGSVICSGPPALGHKVEGAEWVEVPGVSANSTRRFLVFTVR
jgi:16S rRNA (guanine527-N7)-methyltransferase